MRKPLPNLSRRSNKPVLVWKNGEYSELHYFTAGSFRRGMTDELLLLNLCAVIWFLGPLATTGADCNRFKNSLLKVYPSGLLPLAAEKLKNIPAIPWQLIYALSN